MTEDALDYNSSPTLDDRVHVLVSVIPVGSVTLLSDEDVKKMREVRLAASEMGNTQCGLMVPNCVSCIKIQAKQMLENKFLYRQGFPSWLFSPKLMKPVQRYKRIYTIFIRAST